MEEANEYPKAMHGPKGDYRVVKSRDEEDALGDGWVDGHEYHAALAEQDDIEDEAEDTTKPRRTSRGKKAE